MISVFDHKTHIMKKKSMAIDVPTFTDTIRSTTNSNEIPLKKGILESPHSFLIVRLSGSDQSTLYF